MPESKHEDIIIAFRKGDEKAFGSIYDIFYGALYYFICRILGNNAEAQEITADTFLKLWKLRDRFENIQNVKAFLYITARNASLNAVRQKKENDRRHQDIGYFLAQDTEGPSLQDEIKSEVLRQLLGEINNLPHQCRKICELSFIRGSKNNEIAEELGLTLQTVKNHKTRAIKLLKSAMEAKEWHFLLLLQFAFIY